MSKELRGIEVSGTEPLGGETVEFSKVLIGWSGGDEGVCMAVL